MADIKTNLREISVLVGISNIVNNEGLIFDAPSFFNKASLIIPIDHHQHIQNLNLPRFNSEQLKIIENGYKLASKIVNKFNVLSIDSLEWHGFDVYKEDPIDITVNCYGFSLKEESFILENMGLYKLVNLFTGSNFAQLHIFEDYALKEYKDWLRVTINLLVDYLRTHNNRWSLVDTVKGKKSEIILIEDDIHLVYTNRGTRESSVIKSTDTLDQFKIKTNSKTREQVFSKWINNVISTNPDYLRIKKYCSETAAYRLASYLLTNLNYTDGLPRFLRIHDTEYYYAKTTDTEQTIYKVPSVTNYTNDLEIESIIGSVPSSQVNIITTIRNKKTNKRLVLRNECRFSHGQFNGTPEAKMYYERGNSLLAIYNEI